MATTEKVGLVVQPPAPGDICDRGSCPAVALVRVELLLNDLVFCGHHFDADKTTLLSTAFGYFDAREDH